MTITRKTIAPLIVISTTALLSSGVSLASLDNQFSLCAATALEGQSAKAKQINVKLPSNQPYAMDHAASSKFREFKMELTNAKSGKQLGRVSCRVNDEGQVESVQYLTKA